MTIKAFLLRHLRKLGDQFDLTVIANTGDMDLLVREGINAQLRIVSIVRPIRPWTDMRALVALVANFACGRFRGIISITPKAGLLSMLAAFIARVPVRIHIFTGQVWATRSGFARILLKSIDRLMAGLATHVLVDGEPQRQFLIVEGVLRADKSLVLGSGSLSGVDSLRFRPDPQTRAAIRGTLAVPEEALLFLYVGRLNHDKGIIDLAQAFARLAHSSSSAHLLIVGPDETEMRSQVQAVCAEVCDQLHFVGYTDTPERYMAAADVFCLPSYREGFPTSVLEAAASGIPTIASRIYGIVEAVLDGSTGVLHAPGDVEEILACMQLMLESSAQRMVLGNNALKRALNQFSAEEVTNRLAEYVLASLDQSL